MTDVLPHSGNGAHRPAPTPKKRKGFLKVARVIDWDSAGKELVDAMNHKRSFTLKDLRRANRFSANSARKLINKLEAQKLVKEVDRHGRCKAWCVVNHVQTLALVREAPAAKKSVSIKPTEALQSVIGTHDPGPMRSALEKALHILQEVNRIADVA